jgi:exodeoxyribonuclease V alpha subunit
MNTETEPVGQKPIHSSMAIDKLQKFKSKLHATGIFSAIDLQFAGFVLRFSTDQDPDVFLAAALVSRATTAGHICLDLDSVSEILILEQPAIHETVCCPMVHKWRPKLAAHPAVGTPGDRSPLILDDQNRLYLYRYWEYEKKLSASIRSRASGVSTDFRPRKVKACLDRLFPTRDKDVDWQKVSAIITLLKRFSVITGGPGSGKTHTIAGILAFLLECSDGDNLKIHLTAPTGKAAARLGESIMQAKKHLNCSPAVKDEIPSEVSTIHRLLKPITGTPYFGYDSANQLPADVVVVDEASMVDLALMSKLLQAIAPNTRLLIVGDKDQLASVEAGSVLGDICHRQALHGFSVDFLKHVKKVTGMATENFAQMPETQTSLQDCICSLQKNYRFSSRSGIGAISRAINRGDIQKSMDLLKKPPQTTVEWVAINTPNDLSRQLAGVILAGYRKYLTIKDPVLAMKAFNKFKILCALKIGPFGATSVNKMAEQFLGHEKLIGDHPAGNHPWYRGRPIMITKNDYSLGLYNGDIGLTLTDPNGADGQLHVYFQDATGDIRRFPAHRLPEHETVYAMTVHKSQGSEFDHVILILPDKDYPLMTRELIYTGLTRARRKVSIWGTESVLRLAISRKIERSSGLREALWG